MPSSSRSSNISTPFVLHDLEHEVRVVDKMTNGQIFLQALQFSHDNIICRQVKHFALSLSLLLSPNTQSVHSF